MWRSIVVMTAFLAVAGDTPVTVKPVKTDDLVQKKAYFVDNSGYYVCPDGSFLYVRKLPSVTEKGKPPEQEDFNYYRVTNDGVIVQGHPSKFYYTCISEPK